MKRLEEVDMEKRMKREVVRAKVVGMKKKILLNEPEPEPEK